MQHPCATDRENNEASSLKEQIAALTKTVASLANEFQTFKAENKREEREENVERRAAKPWTDEGRVKKMKASLCIQSNGAAVDMNKVKEIATTHRIQVSKATVKENGDVYVDLPSEENREKLTPLLNDETFAVHNVVELKSKLPTISILDVKQFASKDDFVEKVMNQNPEIKALVEAGSTFSVVYSKDPPDTGDKKFYQVVVRVSEEVRKVIKQNNNKIYVELMSYRVVDRFYVKRCNKCQKFGHYEKDCQNEECCGHCTGGHHTVNCEIARDDHENHECVNCKENGKDHKHSATWYKCPMYIEMQKKLKKAIPYYQKN